MSIGDAARMERIVVLIVAMLGVAHADDAAPVTLGQALAAVERAPAAQIGGYDIAAAS